LILGTNTVSGFNVETMIGGALGAIVAIVASRAVKFGRAAA
jgi:hypothetical protein